MARDERSARTPPRFASEEEAVLARDMAPSAGRPVPRTFLFSDLRGYTDFVERFGDQAAARLLGAYRSLVRAAIAREQGAEIKTEGDSFYVVFDSSVSAIRCALAIQRGAARRRRQPLRIGVGIHVGEASPFDQQYVGGAVNIAARLAAAAGPGEILVSDTVRGLTRTAAERWRLLDRGPLALKGIAEPIHAYAVRVGPPPEPAPAAPPAPSGNAAPEGPMTALRRGDPAEAARLAQVLPADSSVEARCEALAALTIVTAAGGDVDAALARTEHLRRVCLRTRDRSWLQAAYALRAWLYGLARQPGEAQAELDRALEHGATTETSCLALLLSASLIPPMGRGEAVRRIARAPGKPAAAGAGGAVADVLEGRAPPEAARDLISRIGGPFLSALIAAQLCVLYRRDIPAALEDELARAGAARLLDLILAARHEPGNAGRAWQ